MVLESSLLIIGLTELAEVMGVAVFEVGILEVEVKDLLANSWRHLALPVFLKSIVNEKVTVSKYDDFYSTERDLQFTLLTKTGDKWKDMIDNY